MRIRLLAFATASTALGGGDHLVELAAGATLADLVAQLTAAYPALAPLWPRMAVAVAGELVRDTATPLADGVEVALLPPVSGG
jgi:molybdopterin converting factor small subunit